MKKMSFVDTTLRDGHHSLWAMGMRTGMMAPVGEQLDEIGFKSIEVCGSGHLRKCIRELKENPWERIRLMANKIKKTPITFMMSPSVTVFDITPLSVLKIYVERLAAHGINRAQIIESSNDFNNRLPAVLEMLREVGIKIVIGLVYSISPKHTDKYYAEKATHAASFNPDAIFIKDPAGLLTPERTKTLVPSVLSGAGEVDVEFHGHCTTGLMQACYAEAMALGIETVHTAIPPLSDGSSQPSVFNVEKNCRLLGFKPEIDINGLQPISEHFTEIAIREKLPIGAPLEYDLSQYIHNVPGGVISHLKHQLNQIGIANRLDEVLLEVGKVRAELGYPIMVTPFSQFVCSQATLNVISGDRFKQITDEVIQFVMGHWGKEAAADVDPNLRDVIYNSPRAKHFLNWEVEEINISKVREKMGGPSLSDDDLILRYIAPIQELEEMYKAGPAKIYPTGESPLAHLLKELLKRKRFTSIAVQGGENSIYFN